MQPIERRRLDVRAVLVRDRDEADRPGEPLGRGAGIDREVRHRRRLDLMGLDQDHPEQEDGDQQEQDEAGGAARIFFMGSPAPPSPGNAAPSATFVAVSNAKASRISAGSLQAGPMNEIPIGNPKAKPAGTVRLG